jgi:thymidylate kinase
MWTARLVGALMPRPKLWVLLNAPAEVLQARKQEVAPEESARQCDAYLAFIRKRPSHIVIDATQPLDQVVADTERAIEAVIVKKGAGRG